MMRCPRCQSSSAARPTEIATSGRGFSLILRKQATRGFVSPELFLKASALSRYGSATSAPKALIFKVAGCERHALLTSKTNERDNDIPGAIQNE
jgi:hypothetical protein